MTGSNGHAQESTASTFAATPAAFSISATVQFSPERVKELLIALEIPFESAQIEWRVMNTTKSQPLRGQIVPYADQRAYTDRLNALFTPAGWTRKYTIHTSASFERSKDQKIVAKILVTCELAIFGLGSHSATGEEWADNDNAGTAAEAQAFKRASACFGLGRYLYYFTGTWVDLDDRKRPKSVPQLSGWATPDGWLEGLRPRSSPKAVSAKQETIDAANGRQNNNGGARNSEILEKIERMERIIGKRMYRGLLKSLARVWNPKEITDPHVQEGVLAHMQAAERGLRQAEAARTRAGLAAFAAVLGSLSLSSLDQVDNLKTLHELVALLEKQSGPTKR